MYVENKFYRDGCWVELGIMNVSAEPDRVTVKMLDAEKIQISKEKKDFLSFPFSFLFFFFLFFLKWSVRKKKNTKKRKSKK